VEETLLEVIRCGKILPREEPQLHREQRHGQQQRERLDHCPTAQNAPLKLAATVAQLVTLICRLWLNLLSDKLIEHCTDAVIVAVVASIKLIPPRSAYLLNTSEPAGELVTNRLCFGRSKDGITGDMTVPPALIVSGNPEGINAAGLPD
jgi:hypothetical protein